jgi:hypothetical protein
MDMPPWGNGPQQRKIKEFGYPYLMYGEFVLSIKM